MTIRGARRGIVGLVAVGAVAAFGVITQGEPSKPKGMAPVSATLQDLAWMTGSWAGTGLGGRVEEHWTSADGQSMVGMFRLVGEKDGFQVAELMIIEQMGTHITYRFRHFGPGHKAWEETDKPLVFDLIRVSAREAVFHSAVQERPIRLTYRLLDEKRLDVHVQSAEKGELADGFHVVMSRTVLGK